MAVKKGEGTQEVVFSTVTIPRWGESITGWLTRPQTTPAPALLIAPGAWGVTGFIEYFCHRLSRQGFTCLAVEPYARGGKPKRTATVEQARHAYASFPPAQAPGDLRAGLEFLIRSGDADIDRVAALGFGEGGRDLLELVADPRFAFRGAVLYWASLPSDGVAARLNCPVLGLYGAQDDTVPEGAATAFAASVPAKAEMLVYPAAGHQFADDERETFDGATADDAWDRTLRFLDAQLKA